MSVEAVLISYDTLENNCFNKPAIESCLGGKFCSLSVSGAAWFSPGFTLGPYQGTLPGTYTKGKTGLQC